MRKWVGVLAGSVSVLALPAMAQQAGTDKPTTTVVVTARAPEAIHKIDRSVYDLKNNPQATTGSVSDVLATLPSVTVDANGNVSVRGASVQVLVDGKPSAALKGANLATALQTMPANRIARIEVITNPGAEFHTDAATVINIITRPATGKAPTGTLIVNAGTAARYNLALSGEAGVGKWIFSGGLTQREDQRSNYITVDRITTTPTGGLLTHFAEDNRVKVRIHVTALDAGATYAATDHDSLNLAGNITLRNRPRRDGDSITFFDPTGTVVGDTTTFGFGRQYFNIASLAGTWKHKGAHDGELLTVQARHEEDENLRDFRYDEVIRLPASPDAFYRHAHGGREMIDDLSADYILPLGTDRQFKSGVDLSSDRADNANLSTTTDAATHVETVDPALTNRFLIDQTLSSAYGDYQQPVGKWIIEGGLRVEVMQTRLRPGRTDPALEVSNTQWAPSLYLSRPLSEAAKLHLSYSHRIDRPNPDQLNPLDFVIDAQDIQTGNPYLKPGQTESFEAGYDYVAKGLNFSGTLYARQLRDTIIQDNYYRHPGDTVLITGYVNGGHGASDGMDLSLTLRPQGKLSYSFNTDIFTQSQTAPVDGEAFRETVTSHITKATLTWTPTPADNLQLQALLNGPSLAAQGKISGQNMLNLNYSHKISPRLKFVATATDVLNSVRVDLLIHTDQFRDHTKINIPGEVIYAGFSYKLGALEG